MALRSSLRARWLGWTALYALLIYVGARVLTVSGFYLGLPLSSTSGTVAFIVPTLLACAIGVRFRSWWWGLGPLAALTLPFLALAVRAWILDSGSEAWVWLLAFSMLGAVYGGLLSLAGLVGVWWGQRRVVMLPERDVYVPEER